MGVLLSAETCQRAERLARTHGHCVAANIIGISRTSIWRLKRRGWRPWTHDAEKRAMPTDFAIQSRHMTHDELRQHYKAGSVTVTRWRRELREQGR